MDSLTVPFVPQARSWLDPWTWIVMVSGNWTTVSPWWLYGFILPLFLAAISFLWRFHVSHTGPSSKAGIWNICCPSCWSIAQEYLKLKGESGCRWKDGNTSYRGRRPCLQVTIEIRVARHVIWLMVAETPLALTHRWLLIYGGTKIRSPTIRSISGNEKLEGWPNSNRLHKWRVM